MRFIIVAVLLFLLSACLATPFNPAEPLKSGQGLAFARVHFSGSINTAKLMTYNKNKHFDLYQFMFNRGTSIVVVPMLAGTHAFDNALYLQGGDLLDPDLECVGEFEVVEDEITYIGDIFFEVGDYSEYLVVSSHPYSIYVKDDMAIAAKELLTQYPELATSKAIKKSFVGPFTCENDD